MPASLSIAKDALPLGLSGGVTLSRDVSVGQVLCEADTALDNSDDAVKARRMMISGFAS